jgi:hypothetical protein
VHDTGPAANNRYHALLRAAAGYERLDQAMALSKLARDMAVAGIRARHPGVTDDELRVRLTVRLYGRAAAIRLFGEANVPADAR